MMAIGRVVVVNDKVDGNFRCFFVVACATAFCVKSSG